MFHLLLQKLQQYRIVIFFRFLFSRFTLKFYVI